MSILHYILVDGQPVREPDLLAWGQWMDTHHQDRVLEQTHCGGITVSTVFLGVDQRFRGEGPPLVFETMVFRGDEGDEQVRASTWGEALANHAAFVREFFPAEPESEPLAAL